MHAKTLARDHFLAHHHAFGLHIEADGDALGIDCLDHAAGDLAQLFFVVGQLSLAFRFADALLDHLASRLGGYPSEISRGGLNHDQLARFGIRAHPAGIVQADLGARIFNRVDDFLFGENRHFARLRVDLGFHVLGI